MLWVGILAVPVGQLNVGDEMRAHFGVFVTFRDGRIVRQRNYDCFDPFQATTIGDPHSTDAASATTDN